MTGEAEAGQSIAVLCPHLPPLARTDSEWDGGAASKSNKKEITIFLTVVAGFPNPASSGPP